MTLSDLWVTSLYPPPIHTDFQVSVGFPLGLLDILDWLPYFVPDLCWSLGVVLIGSLLVHAYTGMEDDGVLDVVAQGQPYPSLSILILNGPGSMGRVLLIWCVHFVPNHIFPGMV